jgi:hypothetical protein
MAELAEKIRTTVKSLNHVLKEASMYGMEVLVEHSTELNEKAKIAYDQYSVKKIVRKEEF